MARHPPTTFPKEGSHQRAGIPRGFAPAEKAYQDFYDAVENCEPKSGPRVSFMDRFRVRALAIHKLMHSRRFAEGGSRDHEVVFSVLYDHRLTSLLSTGQGPRSLQSWQSIGTLVALMSKVDYPIYLREGINSRVVMNWEADSRFQEQYEEWIREGWMCLPTWEKIKQYNKLGAAIATVKNNAKNAKKGVWMESDQTFGVLSHLLQKPDTKPKDLCKGVWANFIAILMSYNVSFPDPDPNVKSADPMVIPGIDAVENVYSKPTISAHYMLRSPTVTETSRTSDEIALSNDIKRGSELFGSKMETEYDPTQQRSL